LDTQLIAILLLVELVLLISTAAPLSLSGRFKEAPNLGILTWLLLLSSAIAATVSAVLIAASFVFQSYFELQSGGGLLETLAVSFAPWLLLGFGGVLLAITNLRLAPYFEAKAQDLDLGLLATKHTERFEGVVVRELSLPGYFAIARNNQIFLSTAALQLPIEQKRAVLWHELGHLKLGHSRLRAISAFAVMAAPWFLVSRVFDFELQRLCELAADNYALKRVDIKTLRRARSLFL
jgi:Zn-dependent protease with chaperone function